MAVEYTNEYLTEIAMDHSIQLPNKQDKIPSIVFPGVVPANGQLVRRNDNTFVVGNGVHATEQLQAVGEDWNTFGLLQSYVARGIPAPTFDIPTIGSSPVTGGTTEPYNTANITMIGCNPVHITAPYAAGTKDYFQNQCDSRTSSKVPWAIEFTYDGSDIAVLLHSHVTTPRFWIWVDGKPVGRTGMQRTGADPGGTYDGAYNIRMTWTAAKSRRIRIYFVDADFGEISHPAGTNVAATTPIETSKAVFLGDSWFDTDSDFKWPNHIPSLIGLFMGWHTMVNGISSTGYVNPGSVSESSIFGSAQRLAQIYTFNPDYIIISGTINDDNYSNVGVAATALYAALATNLPNAKLIVVGRQPVGITNMVSPKQQYYDVMNAAKAAPNVLGFVDPMRENWLTGPGKVTLPFGNGNNDWYLGNSGTHIGNVGAWYYATKITGHILRLLDKAGRL